MMSMNNEFSHNLSKQRSVSLNYSNAKRAGKRRAFRKHPPPAGALLLLCPPRLLLGTFAVTCRCLVFSKQVCLNSAGRELVALRSGVFFRGFPNPFTRKKTLLHLGQVFPRPAGSPSACRTQGKRSNSGSKPGEDERINGQHVEPLTPILSHSARAHPVRTALCEAVFSSRRFVMSDFSD
jgi:hypothetical protein